MTAFQELKNLFEEEARPSPFKVAQQLAGYFEARGAHPDDLAVKKILNDNGFRDPFSVACHINLPLLGETPREKAVSAQIQNIQVYLSLGARAPQEEINALKLGF